MPCNILTDPLGCAGQAVAGTFAEQMREGAAWVIETTVGWWINVDGIDLAATPVAEIKSLVLPLAVIAAVAGMLWQGLRMTISRRPDPLFDVGRGLITLAVWAAIGGIAPAMALRAGDDFASWALVRGAGGGAADRLVALASMEGVTAAGAVIVLALLMMIAGLIQAILMMFREGAVVILAGVIVLAAAGSFTQATRPWLQRVLGWMLALIAYKPAAALVYAAALTLAGDGEDPRAVVMGLTMIVLSIVALPVLMKFFTWAVGRVESSGGAGMAALAGASAAGIHAAAAMRAGATPGGAAGAQAQHIRSDLGPPAGPAGPSPAGAAPTPTTPGPTPGPGATAAAPMASTANAASTSATSSAAGVAGPVAVGVLVAKTSADRSAKAAGDAMTDHEGRQA